MPRIAGVDLKIQKLNGQDPKAYILSSNIARRHMTAGQRAMAYARIYPERGGKGRGKMSEIGHFPGVTRQRVAEARVVLEFAPDLVDAVIAGGTIISDGDWLRFGEARKA